LVGRGQMGFADRFKRGWAFGGDCPIALDPLSINDQSSIDRCFGGVNHRGIIDNRAIRVKSGFRVFPFDNLAFGRMIISDDEEGAFFPAKKHPCLSGREAQLGAFEWKDGDIEPINKIDSHVGRWITDLDIVLSLGILMGKAWQGRKERRP